MAATGSGADAGPARDEPGGSSSLGDRVYRTLRDEIVFLDLPPGAPVREVDVAKRLGVGRTPVREALQRLAMNYLVELLPGRGAFVAPISLPDLVKITEIRVNLEGFAAASADAQMMQPPLYWRLGGTPAITAVVDDFVGNVAADRRINRFFARTDIARLKFYLVQQICAGTGGPCIYSGRDMRTVHAGMGIKSRHFNALVQDLGKTLNKFKVGKTEQDQLLGVLGPMKAMIVEKNDQA